jgi:hypothetical protein
MKESISSSERMSTRWREHGDRAKRQELDRLRELEELRDLCDSQARIIQAMQKQLDIAHRVEFAKRRAPRDASRDFSG